MELARKPFLNNSCVATVMGNSFPEACVLRKLVTFIPMWHQSKSQVLIDFLEMNPSTVKGLMRALRSTLNDFRKIEL
jgi:hypothetical protein